MENKNSLLIRKYMNLMESINNKLITNEKMLNEDLFQTAALTGKIAADELEGYFKMMIKDSEIAQNLTNSGIKTSEELLIALKGNKLNSTLKGSLELSILKSNTKNATLIDIATENLVRNPEFKEKYAAEFAKGQPAYEKALKSAGYSDDAITKIVQKRFNQINPKTGKPYDRPQTLKKGDVDISTNKPKKITDPTDTTKLTNPKDPTFWEKLKTIGWKKALLLGAGAVGGSVLLWYWFKQNKIEDEDIPSEPPLEGEWAPCLKKILDSKQGRVDKLTSGKLVVKVINDTYPDGVLFFADGKVLTNDGKRKGTWKCKEGKVTDVKEQSTTGSNLSADVQSVISSLEGNVITTDGLNNVNFILDKYIQKGQGKQFLDLYKKTSGNFLEKTLISKTSISSRNDPNKNAIRDKIYGQIRKMKGGGGTSTSDPLSGIEIIWDDKKKEEVIPKPPKDTYVNCPNFPLYFGCKGPLVSELQTCLKMTGVDGKLGPNTKATAEAWGTKNNIELKEGFPGGGGRFAVTEENFKKICGGKPVPVPEPIKPQEDPIIPTPVKPEDPKPVNPKEDPVIPTPVNTEDLGEKLYDRLRAERSLIYKEGMFGGGDRKAIYRGGELSEDEEKLLIGYMGTKNYSLSRENEDYSKGDKLVFKRKKRK